MYKKHILGIDPGRTTGISLLDVDNGSNYTRCIVFNGVLEYSNELMNVLTTYKPVMVGVETPFINHRFPSSGLWLSKLMGIIELTLAMWDNSVYVYKFAPKYIKAYFGSGDYTKDDLGGIINKQNIKTHHEVDASAISLMLYNLYKANPLILHRLPD